MKGGMQNVDVNMHCVCDYEMRNVKYNKNS